MFPLDTLLTRFIGWNQLNASRPGTLLKMLLDLIKEEEADFRGIIQTMEFSRFHPSKDFHRFENEKLDVSSHSSEIFDGSILLTLFLVVMEMGDL